jgi:hypothetical protein
MMHGLANPKFILYFVCPIARCFSNICLIDFVSEIFFGQNFKSLCLIASSNYTLKEISRSIAMYLWYQKTMNREELRLLLGYESICRMLSKVSTHNSWGI